MRLYLRFSINDFLDLFFLSSLSPSSSLLALLRFIVKDSFFNPLYDIFDKEKKISRIDKDFDTISSRIISSTARFLPIDDFTILLKNADNAPTASIDILSTLSKEPLIRAKISISSVTAPSKDDSVIAFDVLKNS